MNKKLNKKLKKLNKKQKKRIANYYIGVNVCEHERELSYLLESLNFM